MIVTSRSLVDLGIHLLCKELRGSERDFPTGDLLRNVSNATIL
jgi:hypothetical protein